MGADLKRKRATTSVIPVSPMKKQKHSPAVISKYFNPLPKAGPAVPDDPRPSQTRADMSEELERIARSSLTAFRKQMLSLLCEIPPGRYSTYQALSDHVTATSHPTCARAVGNAMRNNPFAPQVPCHRVLAADGTLGGFGGHWGESGKYASRKHELLHDEGVRFDSRGKVKGPVFREFGSRKMPARELTGNKHPLCLPPMGILVRVKRGTHESEHWKIVLTMRNSHQMITTNILDQPMKLEQMQKSCAHVQWVSTTPRMPWMSYISVGCLIQITVSISKGERP
nr:methylated-dna--protein-cysteine methyltransferase [Quercus suber]